jgi:hypothetical protein
MSGLRALLSPSEEVALRRVALGATDGLAPAHVQRLRHLNLIEPDRSAWRLTALGQQRFKALSASGRWPSGGASDDIEQILGKFTPKKR